MQRSVASFVALAFSFLCIIVAPAQATMVSTGDILQQHDRDLAREKVVRFMDRQDVVKYLKAWGVDPAEAKARVAVMTDDEVTGLADRIDQLPAGGDAVGFLLAVAVIVFVVLLITDIIGVTDVFTFIKKR
jgi:Family of unknown function (DUF6627)